MPATLPKWVRRIREDPECFFHKVVHPPSLQGNIGAPGRMRLEHDDGSARDSGNPDDSHLQKGRYDHAEALRLACAWRIVNSGCGAPNWSPSYGPKPLAASTTVDIRRRPSIPLEARVGFQPRARLSGISASHCRTATSMWSGDAFGTKLPEAGGVPFQGYSSTTLEAGDGIDPHRTIGFQFGSSSWIVWSQLRSAIEASTKVHGCARHVVVSTRLGFGCHEQDLASTAFPCDANRSLLSTRWVAYTHAYTHSKNIGGQMRSDGSTRKLNRKGVKPGLVHMGTN
jgi:hypothetical protein